MACLGRSRGLARSLYRVMAGLVPAIHVPGQPREVIAALDARNGSARDGVGGGRVAIGAQHGG